MTLLEQGRCVVLVSGRKTKSESLETIGKNRLLLDTEDINKRNEERKVIELGRNERRKEAISIWSLEAILIWTDNGDLSRKNEKSTSLFFAPFSAYEQE